MLYRGVRSAGEQEATQQNIICYLRCVNSLFVDITNIFTPHAQRERGKVIGRGVHIYIYIYICVCGRKKNLNRTLEIDSPFQTLTVGLLVEFID